MNIIVDTVIWSIALRREPQERNTDIVNSFRSLVVSDRAVLMGAIRQEILSGLRHQEQFERLQTALRRFSDLNLTAEDYKLAASPSPASTTVKPTLWHIGSRVDEW